MGNWHRDQINARAASTELAVGQPKVLHDRNGCEAEHRPVGKVDQHEQKQQARHDPGVNRIRRLGRGCGLRPRIRHRLAPFLLRMKLCRATLTSCADDLLAFLTAKRRHHVRPDPRRGCPGIGPFQCPDLSRRRHHRSSPARPSNQSGPKGRETKALHNAGRNSPPAQSDRDKAPAIGRMPSLAWPKAR
jgi:hypothetical protein